MFVGVALLYALILLETDVQYWREILVSYVCCWNTAWFTMFIAWWRVGKRHHVHLGLLANFFINGALMGTAFAIVLNTLLIDAWTGLSPHCNPQNIQMRLDCNTEAALMWIFTPGLVEETFKSVWLFFRLRRGPEDLPGRCCFCLPARRTRDCGCWFKLAPTPYHVFLCALASGAGFECLENLVYVFLHSHALQDIGSPKVRQLMLSTALARMFTSGIHMVWTGLIGLGLARRLFLPEAKRPWLPAVLLPSMLAHGLFDYSVSAMNAAVGPIDRDHIDRDNPPEVQNPGLVVLFFFLAAGVITASLGLLGLRTGCSCCSAAPSCCCAPGFWEAAFDDFAGAPSVQVQLHPPECPAPGELPQHAAPSSQDLPGDPMTRANPSRRPMLTA